MNSRCGDVVDDGGDGGIWMEDNAESCFRDMTIFLTQLTQDIGKGASTEDVCDLNLCVCVCVCVCLRACACARLWQTALNDREDMKNKQCYEGIGRDAEDGLGVEVGRKCTPI